MIKVTYDSGETVELTEHVLAGKRNKDSAENELRISQESPNIETSYYLMANMILSFSKKTGANRDGVMLVLTRAMDLIDGLKENEILDNLFPNQPKNNG